MLYMDHKTYLQSEITDSIEVKKKLLADDNILDTLASIIDEITTVFKKDGKVLLCGNGGSAADAQHIAAELSGRFKLDRKPLFAEALHVNSSYLTAVANDYGFEYVYARLLEAKGTKGDVLIAISTSGTSPNIIKAMEEAKKQNMVSIGLTGTKQTQMNELADYCINVPSDDTARIQEVHILIGHIICGAVEKELFS